MKKRIYWRVYGVNSFIAALGSLAAAVFVFFLALPIFLAAVVLFGSAGAYMAWRLRKVLNKLDGDLSRRADSDHAERRYSGRNGPIIDVTPEDVKKLDD
ncbi:MAG: hypothetical protein M0022_01065 [Desulfobacteraceae bacterium]|nr:hypothetical protein [Desulfobacteraceae bacterium]